MLYVREKKRDCSLFSPVFLCLTNTAHSKETPQSPQRHNPLPPTRPRPHFDILARRQIAEAPDNIRPHPRARPQTEAHLFC